MEKGIIKKYCAVVPVYIELPTISEEESLKQLLRTIPSIEIVFVCSHQFGLDHYIDILDETGHNYYSTRRFSSGYFKSREAYSRLLLSLHFYFAFIRFKYILIYQLDSWIFRDELDEWCDKGYDYIGAPWFEGFEKANENSRCIGAGNGGFSLRRVAAQIKSLLSFHYVDSPWNLWRCYRSNHSSINLWKLVAISTFKNNTFFLFNDTAYPEDLFFAMIVAKKCNWYKLANPKVSARFSTEVNSERMFEHNSRNLPFGCHAWERYDVEFWKRHIKI